MLSLFRRTPLYAFGLLLLAVSLFANACGTDSSVLQGDTSAAAAEPTAAAAEPSEATAAPTEPASLPQAGQTDTDEAETAEVAVVEDPEEEDTAVVLAVAPGGASDTITDTRFTVRSVDSTNSDLGAFLRGEPELDCCDRNWIVVNAAVENTIQRFWFGSRTDIALRDPAGNEYTADHAYDAFAEADGTPSFEGRDSRELRIVFETQELIEDVSDWDIIISGVNGDDVLPLVLPLSGPAYVHNYPIALADGATAEFASGEFISCDGANFSTTVDRIEVAVEDSGEWQDGFTARDEAIRVEAGDRLVAIDLAIAGQAETWAAEGNFDFCGSPGFWPDFLLDVDGFQLKAERQTVPNVEGIEASIAQFLFKIPTATETIALLGGAGQTTLASWSLNLPGELGEEGVALVPDTAAELAPPAEVQGERPLEATTIPLTEGGAAGTFMRAETTLRAVAATNVSPEAFVNGQDEVDDSGRTWVIADLEVVGVEGTEWRYFPSHFVLQLPGGQPHGGQEVFDQVGDKLVTVVVDGPQRQLVRVAFETNGLIAEPGAWTVRVENGDDVPLVLPLVGEAISDWPQALQAGQTATLTYDQVLCSDATLDVEVVDARVDLEGPRAGSSFDLQTARVDPDHLAIVINLAATNPKEEGSFDICVILAAWPGFLLDVDGRLTAPYRHDRPTIKPFETETLPLHYEIPKDTQTISLLGGDGLLIATWQLKDAGEVLTDLGAEDIDNRTLITLDETVLFAFGESTLQQSATAPLTRIASVINSDSSGDIEIVGHTDSVGDDASNEALSLARAEAVAAALVAAGVDADRLIVTGEGERSPVAANETDAGVDNPAGRAQNRRVEILFTANS